MDSEINLKLHAHVWNVLTDLAIDETFSEREAQDVRDAMGDLAEMLIDSLNLKVLQDQIGPDGQLILTVQLEVE